jgi:hypothetical protein
MMSAFSGSVSLRNYCITNKTGKGSYKYRTLLTQLTYEIILRSCGDINIS